MFFILCHCSMHMFKLKWMRNVTTIESVVPNLTMWQPPYDPFPTNLFQTMFQIPDPPHSALISIASKITNPISLLSPIVTTFRQHLCFAAQFRRSIFTISWATFRRSSHLPKKILAAPICTCSTCSGCLPHPHTSASIIQSPRTIVSFTSINVSPFTSLIMTLQPLNRNWVLLLQRSLFHLSFLCIPYAHSLYTPGGQQHCIYMWADQHTDMTPWPEN